jgi:hypothetical protein
MVAALPPLPENHKGAHFHAPPLETILDPLHPLNLRQDPH